MEPESTYGKRLHKAAREDFRNFWSGHRLWVTFSTLISPFLVQAKLRGWSSLLTGQETLESAALALGLSLAGNYMIALWGGAKSLDAELRIAIAERDKEIQQRDQEISTLTGKPNRTPAEEHHFREAEALLQKLSEPAKLILRYIWTHKDLRPTPNGVVVPYLTPDQAIVLLHGELASTPLIKRTEAQDFMGPIYSWEITPGFRKVLGELLFPPVTRPSA